MLTKQSQKFWQGLALGWLLVGVFGTVIERVIIDHDNPSIYFPTMIFLGAIVLIGLPVAERLRRERD